MSKMLIVDGVRYREEDAKARGLIGERKVPKKNAAADKSQEKARTGARKPANKASAPATK